MTAGPSETRDATTAAMEYRVAAFDFQTSPWSLFATIGEAFCVCTMLLDDGGRAVDYRFDLVNELFETATGLADPVGKTARDVVPGLEQSWIDTYAEVALGGRTVRFEQGSDALERWFEVVATPLDGPHQFAIVFKDATERHRAEQAQHDVEQRFRALADELPVIAWLHDAEGALVFVNQTYCDYFGVDRSEMIEGRWQALTHPDDAAAYADDFADAVAQRRPFASRVRMRRADGTWRWLESWGRPRFDESGTYLGHIGASLDVTDRVELEQQRTDRLAHELRARHEAEVLERHADGLTSCVTRDDVARTTLEQLATAFELRAAAVDLLEGDRLRVIAGDDVDRSSDGWNDELPLDPSLPGPRAVVENAEQVIYGREALAREYPQLSDMFERHRLESMVALPLRDQAGRPQGAVVAGTPAGRRLGSDELALLREVVDRSGNALERATLYERLHEAHRREREIAVRLQQALLPDDLAEVDGVEIVTRYIAADDVMQVGGDWFDTFAWTDGRIATIVGDVVGHDLEAAATMGRLRAATAALIPLGDPRPGGVLAALDRCARGRGGVDFVTAACVVVDPSRGRLSYGSAGHPPPLLVDPSGATRWLDAATAPPIGQIEVGEWSDDVFEIEPGTIVLLYTDGLVERRGVTLSEGMERLREVASRAATGSLDAVVDRIVEAMVGVDPSEDDVIAVALRWTGVDPT
jgi:PAS domain S-box-containing protein